MKSLGLGELGPLLDGCLGTVHFPKRSLVRPGLFVEFMAGSRGIARAVARAGITSVSFDIVDHPEQDVMSVAYRRLLDRAFDSGFLVGLWIGLVCSTWSMARRNTTGRRGWPAPLRDSNKYLWGLPGLPALEARRVKEASKQVRWAIQIFRRAAVLGTTCVVENPAASRV